MNRERAKAQVGEGWHLLIDEVYDKGIGVWGVKEKWGGLRISMISGTTEEWDFLEEIEERSLTVCEMCGEPGTPTTKGWIKTLCDKHMI